MRFSRTARLLHTTRLITLAVQPRAGLGFGDSVCASLFERSSTTPRVELRLPVLLMEIASQVDPTRDDTIASWQIDTMCDQRCCAVVNSKFRFFTRRGYTAR